MKDDTKLKIILYTIVVLTVIAVVGAWELFVKPIYLFVSPIVVDIWNSFVNVASTGI